MAGEANAGKRLTVLRAIDKLDRLGLEEVTRLLGRGRKDESGDFTKGAELDQNAINIIVNFVGAKDVRVSSAQGASNNTTLANIQTWIGSSAVGLEGYRELEALARIVDSAGYADGRIVIDPSVVRGLEYYTGPVYEADLTFQTKDGTRFGSVGGGGRYDGLVARFRGEAVPATGFSIGVSRLMAALQHLGKLDTKTAAGPVVVTVFDQDRIADYQRMVKALRDAGINAELYLGSGKMGPQLKYADKRGAPCVVIQGGDEKAKRRRWSDQGSWWKSAGGSPRPSPPTRNGARRARRSSRCRKLEGCVEAVREVLARHSK